MHEFVIRKAFAGKIRIHELAVAKILQVVGLASGNRTGNGCYRSQVMDPTDNRRAEFMVHAGRDNQSNALRHRHSIAANRSNFLVPIQFVLHVHSHVIYQSLVEQGLEYLGMAPVGIQFYQESQIPNTAYERYEIIMQSGLSATNDHAVQFSDAFPEKIEERFLGYRIRLVQTDSIREYELGIVTVSASKVTPGSPYDCRQFFGVIEERHGLDCRYLHDFE